MKLSYSCCPKIKSRIAGHKRKLLLNQADTIRDNCNCQDRQECPMRGEQPCNVGSVIYEAEVSHPNLNGVKTYIGGSNDFKTRSYRHKQSFRDINLQHDSALSEFVWTCKNKGFVPNIKFKVLAKAKEYSAESKKCYLCCKEKIEIMRNINDPENLNSRSELMGKCRHRNKFLLSHVNLKNFVPKETNLNRDSPTEENEDMNNENHLQRNQQADQESTQIPGNSRKLRNGKVYPWKT